jgi:putative transposase
VKANQANAKTARVATMCRVLGVSASGYYDWRNRAPCARVADDAVLVEQVRAIHAESDQTYGRPRMRGELRAQGRVVNAKRIARLMRKHGLRGVSRRRGFVVTTRRDKDQQRAPDLVQRCFEATSANQLWVADMTYVPTWAGFIYLAVVLDVWSRRIVGWAIGEHMTTELVITALNMALQQRRPKGVIHHSDQGCQYTSLAFGKRCAQMGVRPSMGSVGDAYDNAMAESFFATLECELIDEVAHLDAPRLDRHRRVAARGRPVDELDYVAVEAAHRLGVAGDAQRARLFAGAPAHGLASARSAAKEDAGTCDGCAPLMRWTCVGASSSASSAASRASACAAADGLAREGAAMGAFWPRDGAANRGAWPRELAVVVVARASTSIRPVRCGAFSPASPSKASSYSKLWPRMPRCATRYSSSCSRVRCTRSCVSPQPMSSRRSRRVKRTSACAIACTRICART